MSVSKSHRQAQVYKCSYCGAGQWEPCKTKSGNIARSAHKARRRKFEMVEVDMAVTHVYSGSSCYVLDESVFPFKLRFKIETKKRDSGDLHRAVSLMGKGNPWRSASSHRGRMPKCGVDIIVGSWYGSKEACILNTKAIYRRITYAELSYNARNRFSDVITNRRGGLVGKYNGEADLSRNQWSV